MNAFFTDSFYIVQIQTCVRVVGEGGNPYHKDRPSHGLVWQVSGKRNYIFEDGTYMTVQAGDVFYLPKCSTYEVVTIESGDCVAVNFLLADGARTYPCFKQTPSGSARYAEHFPTMLRHWNTRDVGYENRVLAGLYSVIGDIQTDAARSYIPPQTRRLVMEGAAYMGERIFDSALSIQAVAAHLGISPEYFRRIFREEYRTSPRRYLMELRMKRARELLLSGEFSIGEVSRLCGYESESYFSAEFRRICGMTPTGFLGR